MTFGILRLTDQFRLLGRSRRVHGLSEVCPAGKAHTTIDFVTKLPIG